MFPLKQSVQKGQIRHLAFGDNTGKIKMLSRDDAKAMRGRLGSPEKGNLNDKVKGGKNAGALELLGGGLSKDKRPSVLDGETLDGKNFKRGKKPKDKVDKGAVGSGGTGTSEGTEVDIKAEQSVIDGGWQ